MTSLAQIKAQQEARKQEAQNNQNAQIANLEAATEYFGTGDFAQRKAAMMLEAQKDAENGIARIQFNNARYSK